MRRSRRGGHSVLEFGGSGEDSFVAVVVTKLTGALLFILLLSMVIMALVPKAIDAPVSPGSSETPPLAITTPSTLPDAVAGRRYVLALAATGGSPPYVWSTTSALPEGLELHPETGTISGLPKRPTEKPLEIAFSARDRTGSVRLSASLNVLESARPIAPPTLASRLASIPLENWLERGFGFLLLCLIYLVGESVVSSLRRRALAEIPPTDVERLRASSLRFKVYRGLLGATSVAACSLLAFWIWIERI